MDYYKLFLMGRKESMYSTALSEKLIEHLPELKKYPYIDEGIGLHPDTTTYMFFQNEQLKSSFQEKMTNIQVGSPEFHHLLGMTLGYPPKAVDFFVKCQIDSKLKRYKVGMHYLGVPCNGDVYDLVENCIWLWDKYTYPELPNHPLEVRMEYTFYSVAYKDLDRLRELQEMVLTPSTT